ncbi:MAG: HupE/UreJ family protein [Acidobacteriota bacterium]
MLFVLGIYLLTGRLRATLLPVTAFTIAHSVSLGLSMYGLVSAPSSVVEPAIAVSIAYVAIENLFLREVRRWRIALVFAFGLLHGLGFAGALGELGLPRTEFAAALVSFNVAVELAQIAVIGVAFALIGWKWSGRTWYHERVVVPGSVAIACVAVYWTVRRVAE